MCVLFSLKIIWSYAIEEEEEGLECDRSFLLDYTLHPIFELSLFLKRSAKPTRFQPISSPALFPSLTWKIYPSSFCWFNTCQISNISNIIKPNDVKRCWFCYFWPWFFQRVYLKSGAILWTLFLYDLLLCVVSNKDNGSDQKGRQIKKCSETCRYLFLLSRKFN